MSDHAEILQEEFEVLESIFPDELEKISDSELRIRVAPDDPPTSLPITTLLHVTYPPTYPDVVPDLALTAEDGELTEEELEELIGGMKTLGEESLGMAMVFTLTTWLQTALSTTLHDRVRKEKEEVDRKFAAAEEAEAARIRGTPVTPESFTALTKRIKAESLIRRARQEEERIKSLTAKEREEFKKMQARPSGKRLFETSKTLATSDMAYEEEGVDEVDFSKYTREDREKARAEEAEREEGVKIYDSD